MRGPCRGGEEVGVGGSWQAAAFLAFYQLEEGRGEGREEGEGGAAKRTKVDGSFLRFKIGILRQEKRLGI